MARGSGAAAAAARLRAGGSNRSSRIAASSRRSSPGLAGRSTGENARAAAARAAAATARGGGSDSGYDGLLEDSKFDSDAVDSDADSEIDIFDFVDETDGEGGSSEDCRVGEGSDAAVLRVLARSIAHTGSGRVLSLHSRAKVGEGCVRSFAVDENRQQLEQLLREFGADWVQAVRLEGLTAEDRGRQELLDEFDATPDDEVFVLASCRTIGEGVDTKHANMVFSLLSLAARTHQPYR